MTQSFPKKQLYVLCLLLIGQSVIQVAIKRGRSEGERDFPTGPFSDWHGGASYKGQFRTYGSNICLRYALEALEKTP